MRPFSKHCLRLPVSAQASNNHLTCGSLFEDKLTHLQSTLNGLKTQSRFDIDREVCVFVDTGIIIHVVAKAKLNSYVYSLAFYCEVGISHKKAE